MNLCALTVRDEVHNLRSRYDDDEKCRFGCFCRFHCGVDRKCRLQRLQPYLDFYSGSDKRQHVCF